EDVTQSIELLERSPQVGAVIPGGEGARKLRVANSDLGKGKSGGYRLLYLYDEEPEPILFLLLLCAKSDRADVGQQELRELLKEAREANKSDAETSGENNEEQAPPA